MTPVEYRTLSRWPGYRIGGDGSVWTCREVKGNGGTGSGFHYAMTDQWRLLKPGRDRYGHRYVCLYVDGKRSWPYVHNLVLEAFVGPRPAGMQGCHFPDRDPSNNAVANLRWDTPLTNADDMRKHGTVLRGDKSPVAKLTEAEVRRIRQWRRDGLGLSQIAAKIKHPRKRVYNVISNRAWRHVQ